MIPHGVEVFVGLEPIDLRWGFDRLAGIALDRVGRVARSGALFVFFVSAARRPSFERHLTATRWRRERGATFSPGPVALPRPAAGS
jgi:hypothetical protein